MRRTTDTGGMIDAAPRRRIRTCLAAITLVNRREHLRRMNTAPTSERPDETGDGSASARVPAQHLEKRAHRHSEHGRKRTAHYGTGHHATARTPSAFGSTPKNFHSLRSRKRLDGAPSSGGYVPCTLDSGAHAVRPCIVELIAPCVVAMACAPTASLTRRSSGVRRLPSRGTSRSLRSTSPEGVRRAESKSCPC